MSLSGTRLKSALAADILTQLQAQYPAPSPALQAAELITFNLMQQKLANAIANASGPDIVSEITTNAQVAVASVTGVTAGGASSGPGTGTVT